MIERSDKKDPDFHFKESAQLKQWDSMDAYIALFQRLFVLVVDISERRLIVLFMDGLLNPLKGWVKALNPFNLQLAIRKVRDMEPLTSKSYLNNVMYL